MLGRKDDGGENLRQVRGRILIYPVELDTLFILIKEYLRGLFPLSRLKIHLQPKEIPIKADQLIFLRSAKGVTAAKEPQRLEQIGLSVGILSVDDVHSLGRRDRIIFQISVIFKVKRVNFQLLPLPSCPDILPCRRL